MKKRGPGSLIATRCRVSGLATEAGTVEALIAKLKPMIPELLELNGVPRQGEVAFEVRVRRFDTAARAVA